MYLDRVVSGMRPTGMLHLGHYHGVLKNWLKLQSELPCLFFVADLHALTTHYMDSSVIKMSTLEMIIDWLAVGIDASKATLFIQSKVPEHIELYLLLSMITPLGWLERVPTYKFQQEKLSDRHLNTYGFLGYPLLQAADILIYRASQVPVGEDQIPHVEMIREIARRFNYLYNTKEKIYQIIKKLGTKNAKLYLKLRTQFQEQKNKKILNQAKIILENIENLSAIDRIDLLNYFTNDHRLVLIEPKFLLTKTSCLPGLDGAKMSKSYNNTITLREDKKSITKKIKTMLTDPKRIHRSDPGNPDKCPVWQFHLVYSHENVKQWVNRGCRLAKIGCLDCKHLIIEMILKEQQPVLERAQQYIDNPSLVPAIIADGCDRARKLAQDTIRDVKEVMGLNY